MHDLFRKHTNIGYPASRFLRPVAVLNNGDIDTHA
jgi:hypothetical protein